MRCTLAPDGIVSDTLPYSGHAFPVDRLWVGSLSAHASRDRRASPPTAPPGGQGRSQGPGFPPRSTIGRRAAAPRTGTRYATVRRPQFPLLGDGASTERAATRKGQPRIPPPRAGGSAACRPGATGRSGGSRTRAPDAAPAAPRGRTATDRPAEAQAPGDGRSSGQAGAHRISSGNGIKRLPAAVACGHASATRVARRSVTTAWRAAVHRPPHTWRERSPCPPPKAGGPSLLTDRIDYLG